MTGQRRCDSGEKTGEPPKRASALTGARASRRALGVRFHAGRVRLRLDGRVRSGPLEEELLLLEEVVHGSLAGRMVRRLEAHRQLTLDAALAGGLGDVEQAHEVDDQRRCEHRVLAEEVY